MTFERLSKSVVVAGCLSALLGIFSVRLVGAQTFSVLHDFVRPGAYPNAPLVRGGDGNYYGTTISGGDADKGTIFRLDSVGNVTVLHSFLGSDGSAPEASLIQAADGSFYGTTVNGGGIGCNDGCGTIFRMDSSGNLTTLLRFTGGADGGAPAAAVIQASDGAFYGTTSGDGTTSFGTIYKMDAAGNLTTLHSFAGTDGALPVAALVQATNRDFYGTTSRGGGSDAGTVFKMDSTGNLTTLHGFNNSEGISPYASLVQATDRNFYGSTAFGGTVNDGTIFKMDLSGRLTTLHSFVGTDGAGPSAGFIQASDGNLYGTTGGGGSSGWGTVFKMDHSGNVTTLHSFTGGADGCGPKGLVQASDGTFYGTTESGGGGTGLGTVFKMDSLGNLTTFLFAGPYGASPDASLIQASDGDFYGTTSEGGTGNAGTIFKMDSSGNVTILHSFIATDGTFPKASLIQTSDGNFYGTTSSGGTNNYDGTVFRMDMSGNVTTLHAFTGGSDGANPRGSLIQASDGYFYGTTMGDGGNFGTIFKMDSSGNVMTLHSFAGTDGVYPRANLIQASDGSFYGTTSAGGPNNYGTVFKMDVLGNLTTLYSFADGTDGSAPQAGLVQGADSMFYGTTSGEDGSDNGGQSTVFRIDSSGNLSTLYRFTGGADGYAPLAGLIQARDGDFYGTTSSGGASANGALFRMDSSGNLTILHSFINASDGGHPTASLLQARDGHYYGTTSDGGSRGGGTIFEIDPSGAGQRGRITPLPIVPPAPIIGRPNLAQSGTWGSSLASLTTTNSDATLQILASGGCYGSYGNIGAPVPRGPFTLTGTFTQLIGAYPGMIQYDANVSGSVAGNQMVITVAVPALQESFGPFNLTYGVQSSWQPCRYPAGQRVPAVGLAAEAGSVR